MLTKIRNLIGDEPVRSAVHSAAVAVLSVLALKGVISTEDALEYGAMLAFILGVEGLRSRVTPVRKVEAEVARAEAGLPRH